MIRLTIRDRNIVQTLRIDTDKAFIGRSPSNTVVLSDAAASRKHGLLRVSGGVVEILDLNSKHGLKVNGEPTTRAFLSVGDRVEIGSAEIHLDEIEADPASLARFGGYLDDDDHLYTIRGDAPGGTATATATATRPSTADDSPDETPAETPARAPSTSTFADDLYKVLRRTPAWGISLLVHAALVLLLFQVPWVKAPSDEAFDSFASGMSDGEEMLEDVDPETLSGMDLPEPDPFTDFPDVPEMDDPRPMEGAERPEPEPIRIPVIAPARSDFETRVTGLGLKNPVKLGTNQNFGTKGSGDANRRASGFVLESIGGANGRLARLLRRRPPRETIVIRGTYDRVETVLDLFQVPYTLVNQREFRTLDLENVRTVFVNCSNETFPEEVARKIGEFVLEGGYLFSTDWALDNVIEKAFPRTIRPYRTRGDQIKGTPDMVIAVSARLKHHFFLQGTGLEKNDAEWWLEDSSYPIRIVRKDLVEVLVHSPELKKKYGAGAVAVTFKWGQGRVVHVMGHYYQKKGNLRGTFAMQKIITNFLVAAIRRR